MKKIIIIRTLVRICAAFSLLLNLIFISLFIIARLSTTSSLSFYNMADAADFSPKDIPFITAATVVSVPQGESIVFTPVDITLKKGQSAHLQFSVFFQNRQISRFTDPLYDRNIVSISQTGLGLIITACQVGDTALQVVTQDGILSIAAIYVTE